MSLDQITLTDSTSKTSQVYRLSPLVETPPTPTGITLEPGVQLSAGVQSQDNLALFFRRGAEYVLNELNLTGKNQILGSVGDPGLPAPKIKIVGPAKGKVQINVRGDGTTIGGLQFASELLDDTQRALAIAVNAHGVKLANLSFANVDTAISCVGKWKDLEILNPTDTSPISIAGYFLWFEGLNGKVTGGSIQNSIYQHIIRTSGDADGLAISGMRLANLDRRQVLGGNANDTAKGCLTIQTAKNISAVNCIFESGPVSVGPLTQDNEPKTPRSENVLLDGCTFKDSALQIRNGSNGVVARKTKHYIEGGQCISIEGFNNDFARGVNGVQISGAEGFNLQGQSGNFVRVWGPDSEVVVDSCVYNAPNLVIVNNGTAPISFYDLKRVRSTNNTWPTPKGIPGWTGGRRIVNHAGANDNADSWFTPEEWKVLFSSDKFQ